MTLTFASPTDAAISLKVFTPDAAQTASDANTPEAVWAKANGFKGAAGSCLVFPAQGGGISQVWLGAGDASAQARGRFLTASAVAKLPQGEYRLDTELDANAAHEFALGWLLASYRYDRYKSQPAPKARLVAPAGINAAQVEAIANGEALTRDLINTPASDMGPAELEAAATAVAEAAGAKITVITGDNLLAQNFPMIHAVGRAAAPHRAPRLIEVTWGTTGPTLTLVGKGVCFDTGGLNIKPGASMGLMKKDMGGSATVLGLAQTIMALHLPLQLRVLIPAVENAISADAFRPQDVLTSRAGLTVEINNTDAEGRLVLADALALAAEAPADLTISMATLTGAARVAVGPDLAPFFTDNDTVANALTQAASDVRDPVWRMPFHTPYEARIEPGIADLDNAPAGGMAGCITAALFLRRFAPDAYMHFDIYGWQPTAAPARPKGGVGQGARAVLAALPAILKL